MSSLLDVVRDDGDFQEAASRAGFDMAEAACCIEAGKQDGDYAETSLVALLEMKDGRFAVLTGWCDTTGWGCQDGADVSYESSESAARAHLADSDKLLLANCPVMLPSA